MKRKREGMEGDGKGMEERKREGIGEEGKGPRLALIWSFRMVSPALQTQHRFLVLTLVLVLILVPVL